MGQFKPMVKMMTTEPTVELKLKKGGTVAHKKMKTESSSGHKPMKKMMDGGILGALSGATPVIAGQTAAPVSRAPARPSLASRRKAMMAKPTMSRPMMKKGGKACYAEGGKVQATKGNIPVSASKKGAEKYVDGDISTAEYTGKSSGNTGDVKLGNGGGYKKGGKVVKKATGGVILGNGGGFKTGGVVLGNGGGYKKGGAAKKAFASGGSVNDEGKATSMSQGNKRPSAPVSISRLSGTFKKGGNVSSKKLQGYFDSENATAVKESKAKLLDQYSPYQKKSKGGEVESAAEHNAEMRRLNKVEKELKSHESKSASKAHVGLKKGGRADGGLMGTTGYKIPMSAPEGNISDLAYTSVMQKEKAGKKDMIDKPLKGKGATSDKERRYPSGLTDSDIDRIINSKDMQEKFTHNIDKKRGGKVGK
jgi:hypothetical protein